MTKRFTYYRSPYGEMTLQADDQGLLGAWFEIHTTKPKMLGQFVENDPILTQTIKQLDEYFAGQRKMFDLPISATGTEFQRKVWQALTTIPYGETWNYLDLANAIGNPKAVRAVGLANGKNPVSVIVPCHRVIGKNGKLTGYAGGVETKAKLLELEQKE